MKTAGLSRFWGLVSNLNIATDVKMANLSRL
jgi:hypothetical protein